MTAARKRSKPHTPLSTSIVQSRTSDNTFSRSADSQETVQARPTNDKEDATTAVLTGGDCLGSKHMSPARPVTQYSWGGRKQGSAGVHDDIEEKIVGRLTGRYRGVNYRLRVVQGKVGVIGKGPRRECDVRLFDAAISKQHCRLHALTTSLGTLLAVLHDVSTNGLLVNHQDRPPSLKAQFQGRSIMNRSIVLRDGDTIEFPGVAGVRFTYKHNWEYQPPREVPHMPDLPEALFPTTDPDLSLSLGRYTIHNLVLGAGSYGIIYLASVPTAEDPRDGSSRGKQAPLQVAVKLCHRCVAAEPGSTMVDEVELLRHVQHPNVLGMLDYIEVGNHARSGLMVMELVTGGDLCTYLDQYHVFTESEVVFFAYQIYRGVRYLHQRGIAHRDLKPENILLHTGATMPRLIITDLGGATTFTTLLQRLAYAPGHVKRCWEPFGTPEYLPPEVLRRNVEFVYCDGTPEGRKRAAQEWFEEEKAVDMWGFGCVLYLCLGGAHLYMARSPPHSASRTFDSDTTREEGPLLPSEQSLSGSLMNFWSNGPSVKESRGGVESLCAASICGSEPMTRSIVSDAQGARKMEVLEGIERFKTMEAGEWEPRHHWARVSDTAKDFVSRCTQYEVGVRARCREIGQHEWFEQNREDLSRSYNKVVVRGEVWNM